MPSDTSRHEDDNMTIDQPPEQAQRPSTHLPDLTRLGVLAGLEDEELRLEAHLVDCPICHQPALELAARAERAAPEATPATDDCTRTRNVLFRFFEQGRDLPPEAIAHLRDCVPCRDHFLEPARCACTREPDEDNIGALD